MSNRIRQFLALGMTSLVAVVPLISAVPAIGAQENKSSTNANQDIPQADILKVSEAFGHFIGRNLNSPGVKFDLESIIKGMREGAAGKPAPMSDKEYEDMMALLQEKAFKVLSENNLTAANEFLKKTAKPKGS